MSLAQRHRSHSGGLRIYGLDFSSAPSLKKPITCAVGRLVVERSTGASLQTVTFYLEEVTALTSLLSFEQFLQTPGPWLAGFDLPFGQPRALIEHEGWPTDWEDFVDFFCLQDREALRLRFKAWCDARPVGDKFAWRKADKPAGSSPAMRWTNPPVAWMMHAAIARMKTAGLVFPAHQSHSAFKHATPYQRWTKAQRADHRLALEAYPGFTARKVCRQSYKSDAPAKQDADRALHRQQILRALELEQAHLSLRLRLTPGWSRRIVMDGSGDLLDAVVCAMQAGHAASLRGFGLPSEASPLFDPLEGWIAAVPEPS
jgi:hypothetical protein